MAMRPYTVAVVALDAPAVAVRDCERHWRPHQNATKPNSATQAQCSKLDRVHVGRATAPATTSPIFSTPTSSEMPGFTATGMTANEARPTPPKPNHLHISNFAVAARSTAARLQTRFPAAP
jgi:hypothetical protein